MILFILDAVVFICAILAIGIFCVVMYSLGKYSGAKAGKLLGKGYNQLSRHKPTILRWLDKLHLKEFYQTFLECLEYLHLKSPYQSLLKKISDLSKNLKEWVDKNTAGTGGGTQTSITRGGNGGSGGARTQTSNIRGGNGGAHVIQAPQTNTSQNISGNASGTSISVSIPGPTNTESGDMKPTNPVPPPSGKEWLAIYDGSTTGEMPIYDPAGRAIVINKQRDLLAKGGEGFVYKIPINVLSNNMAFFIKLYNVVTLGKPDKMRMNANRIERMMGIIPARQVVDIKFLAWPLMKVYSDRNRQNMIGFVMQKVEGKPFCDFFVSPRALREEMPRWGRIDLAKTALNFVQKINCLAKRNIYVNDYNPSNFFAEDNCNVTFIDCDSFQIQDKNNTPLISYARFEAYHAPELKPTQKRDIHQVEFGVAIIVYQLLMVGLHPFQCRDPRGAVDTTSLKMNIKMGRCAFLPHAHFCFPVSRDHFYENLWKGLPRSLQDCFIKTFGLGVKFPSRRATLDELEKGLKDALQPNGMTFVRVMPPPKRRPPQANQRRNHPAPGTNRNYFPQAPAAAAPAVNQGSGNPSFTYIPSTANAPRGTISTDYSMYQIYTPAIVFDDDDD